MPTKKNSTQPIPKPATTLDPDDFSDLTLQQRKLVDEYMILGNKEKAAINAGYPKRSAYTVAYREMKKARVMAYYQYRLTKLREKSEENVAKVLKQLHDIAGADIRDFVTGKGKLKDLNKVDGRLIHGIRHTKNGTDITLTSREKAIELLGRYYGMWEDKLDITTKGDQVGTINVTFQEVTKASMKEAEDGKTKANSGGETTD